MHVLAVNSVSTLLNYLSEQLENTPSLTDIRTWNKIVEVEEEDEFGTKKEEDSKVRYRDNLKHVYFAVVYYMRSCMLFNSRYIW